MLNFSSFHACPRWELGLPFPGEWHSRYTSWWPLHVLWKLCVQWPLAWMLQREEKARNNVRSVCFRGGLSQRVGIQHSSTAFIVICSLSAVSFQDPAVLEAHCTYLTSGTSLVLCLQRPNAVKKLIDILGPEDPQVAQALNPCFWRAQYGISTVQNAFYGRFLWRLR